MRLCCWEFLTTPADTVWVAADVVEEAPADVGVAVGTAPASANRPKTIVIIIVIFAVVSFVALTIAILWRCLHLVSFERKGLERQYRCKMTEVELRGYSLSNGLFGEWQLVRVGYLRSKILLGKAVSRVSHNLKAAEYGGACWCVIIALVRILCRERPNRLKTIVDWRRASFQELRMAECFPTDLKTNLIVALPWTLIF